MDPGDRAVEHGGRGCGEQNDADRRQKDPRDHAVVVPGVMKCSSRAAAERQMNLASRMADVTLFYTAASGHNGRVESGDEAR